MDLFYLVGSVVLIGIIPFLVYLLTQQNLFFTIVKEGQAKAVISNGEFERMLMNYRGFCFAREDRERYHPEDHDEWDIVPDVSEARSHRWRDRLLPRFLQGIEWVGIPPFQTIYSYRFRWFSLEDVVDEKTGLVVKKPIPKSEVIDYILIQTDIYATPVNNAETQENIPVNLLVLITGAVVNAYKALFRVQNWLETTQNQLGARMRQYVGIRTYNDLIRSRDNSIQPITSNDLGNIDNEIEKRIGFRIEKTQISSIDPGSSLAEDFIRASTALYVAEQKAKARIAEGQGEADYFRSISQVPYGPELYKWKQIGSPDSSLATYVESDSQDVKPTIVLNGK